MDPHENLKNQRKLTREITSLFEEYFDTNREEVDVRILYEERIINKAMQLVESVEDLDGWMNAGGFSPWSVK